MKTFRRGLVTVLSLGTDDLTSPPRVEAAFDEILSVLSQKHIVVDMQGVTRLTSMGLSALSAGAGMVRERKGSFALAGLRPGVKLMVERAEGAGLRNVAENVEAALRDVESQGRAENAPQSPTRQSRFGDGA